MGFLSHSQFFLFQIPCATSCICYPLVPFCRVSDSAMVFSFDVHVLLFQYTHIFFSLRLFWPVVGFYCQYRYYILFWYLSNRRHLVDHLSISLMFTKVIPETISRTKRHVTGFEYTMLSVFLANTAYMKLK